MILLYLIALLPIVVGGLYTYFGSDEVSWPEYLIGSAVALITAGIFHYFAYHNLVGDQELHSGEIVQVRFYPRWKEYYEEAIYRTETYTTRDSKGRTSTHTRQVFSHWSPRSRWHEEQWKAFSNIDTIYGIGESQYNVIVKQFGGNKVATAGDRTTGEHASRMLEGDPNDYITSNETGAVVPVNKSVYFENRLKHSRNIFLFEKISKLEAENLKLHRYPEYSNPWSSSRLMGSHSFSPHDLEVLNAKLGPRKKINIICINWGDADSSIAEKQLGWWGPPKKNDFIIQYGRGWVKVFSWSEQEECKRFVESLFLEPDDPQLLEKLDSEIRSHYLLVKWDKFNYIQIWPTGNQILLYVLIVIGTQAICYIVFHSNEHTK